MTEERAPTELEILDCGVRNAIGETRMLHARLDDLIRRNGLAHAPMTLGDDPTCVVCHREHALP